VERCASRVINHKLPKEWGHERDDYRSPPNEVSNGALRQKAGYLAPLITVAQRQRVKGFVSASLEVVHIPGKCNCVGRSRKCSETGKAKTLFPGEDNVFCGGGQSIHKRNEKNVWSGGEGGTESEKRRSILSSVRNKEGAREAGGTF